MRMGKPLAVRKLQRNTSAIHHNGLLDATFKRTKGRLVTILADFRALIGATNPADAAEGTIRAEFAESLAKNAVHGSDSDENANIEADFHFSAEERF